MEELVFKAKLTRKEKLSTLLSLFKRYPENLLSASGQLITSWLHKEINNIFGKNSGCGLTGVTREFLLNQD